MPVVGNGLTLATADAVAGVVEALAATEGQVVGKEPRTRSSTIAWTREERKVTGRRLEAAHVSSTVGPMPSCVGRSTGVWLHRAAALEGRLFTRSHAWTRDALAFPGCDLPDAHSFINLQHTSPTATLWQGTTGRLSVALWSGGRGGSLQSSMY